MYFLHSERLNGLKLFMREDTNKATTYYILEKDFEDEIIFNENISKIVGTLIVHKERRNIDFKINKYSNRFPCIDYQNKGYGTAVLSYIYEDILSKFSDKEAWKITINWSSELFESFKSKLKEKSLVWE